MDFRITGHASQCLVGPRFSASVPPSQCFHGVRIMCFALGFRSSLSEFISMNPEQMQGTLMWYRLFSWFAENPAVLRLVEYSAGWVGVEQRGRWHLESPLFSVAGLPFLRVMPPMPLPWLSYCGSVIEPAQSSGGSWCFPIDRKGLSGPLGSSPLFLQRQGV